jgi:hypothetical protein
MPKTQDDRLLAQVLHDGPHHAETLPTGVANEFPGRVPAKKFLVCICQKLLHFLLSILPNREQLLQIKGNVLCLLVPILDQLSNKSAIYIGGAIPKRICTERQRNLA